MDAFADDDIVVRGMPVAGEMPDGNRISGVQRDFLSEVERIGGHAAGVRVQEAGSGIGAGDIAVLEADIAVVLQVKRVDCRDRGCHVGGDIRFPPAALHEPVDAGGGKAAYGDDRDGSEGAQGMRRAVCTAVGRVFSESDGLLPWSTMVYPMDGISKVTG